ncbi:MAG: hypothetical protein Q9227_007673 [Pyrenula ochraceoflavens]
MSASQLARHRSLSSHSKPVPRPPDASFEPCAATASLFVYAQGPTVVCLHHDTLAVERRFQKHAENIQLISVDNVSERGAGRLVVSYDVGMTAIVWDLFTGHEIARFVSFEHIKVAAWMRNGNVAFGNVKGEIILFEPSSSEHISARTIFDPITALAPSSDCRTYAIGYHNGSILLAALQPAFTILHTLTTARAPSPISALTWHASSSKQKSDMLATQTTDGDLRVWSVAKPPTSDTPRVIRALKRSDTFRPGPNWIAWSKNGRIVQYSERETWAWDVRTKHVTYEPIPTVEDVRALAAYGPTATLFSLGPNHTVQQYDLERPHLDKEVQVLPQSALQTPPEQEKQLGFSTSESEEDYTSPIQRANMEMNAIAASRIDRNATFSPQSNQSRTDSYTSHSSTGRDRHFDPFSPMTMSERTAMSEKTGTVFSMTTTQSHQTRPLPSASSMSYGTQSPVSARSGRKTSRLRQEYVASPDDKPLSELFPYTRARLTDLPYRPPRSVDESELTPDDLRRQMLSVVFGWEEDIWELIRDELSRHPIGSTNAALLSRWLDDDPDHLASIMGSGGTSTSMDWMMLALSGVGNQDTAKKVGQAFVQKMLAKGDIHSAATILLALGDRNDAIEVYVTGDRWMEAVLMTCLVTPLDWQRQSYLVRKWGEHVVENSQQSLAIRCFSCTGVEPSGPWTSPSAQMMAGKHRSDEFSPFNPPPTQHQRPLIRSGMPEAPTPVAMPAPPTPLPPPATGTRMTAKNAALKLITSFGDQPGPQFKFPGLKSDDRTPTNAPGVTPIAESAIPGSAMSPGGSGSYRMNNLASINNALSARTATPGGYRRRLPSIGETPIDVNPPAFPAPKPLPTPDNSGSDKEKESTAAPPNAIQVQDSADKGAVLLSSARYEPLNTPAKQSALQTPATAIKAQPTQLMPGEQSLLSFKSTAGTSSRGSSRSRKPTNLSLHDLSRPTASEMSAEQSQTDVTSPLYSGQSYQSTKSPSVSGRSTDRYISSLDEAYYHAQQQRSHRHTSRNRKEGESRERKRSKNRSKLTAGDLRGRHSEAHIPPAKRSPSSPVPMSPEDLRMYTASVESIESTQDRGRSQPRYEAYNAVESSKNSKPSSRKTSRQHSPEPSMDAPGRSRHRSRRDGSKLRSPSSPLPMSPSGEDIRKYSEPESSLRFVSDDRQRLSSTPRSHSRRPDRSTSARRDASPDRRRHRARSSSRQAQDREPAVVRRASFSSRKSEGRKERRHRDPSADGPPVRQWSEATEPFARSSSHPQFTSDEGDYRPGSIPHSAAERRKREIAAAELEARRLSLARRPSAPQIPLPGQAAHVKSASTDQVNVMPLRTDSLPVATSSFAYRMQAKTSPNEANFSDSNSSGRGSNTGGVRAGLPATPRAMRHPRYNASGDANIPTVPDVPDNLVQLSNDTYRPSIGRAMSAPMEAMSPSGIPDVPLDLPAHPAYNARLPRSRSNSRTRAFSPSRREQSRDRIMSPQLMANREPPAATIGKINTSLSNDNPPRLPELQHLHSPPPPPPPPPQHHTPQSAGTINIGFEGPGAIIDVRPGTAPLEIPSSYGHSRRNSSSHRRGRSVNENIGGKIRAFTDRMRSTSRGRNTKSPPYAGQANDVPSPYESLAPKTHERRPPEVAGKV